jgi:flavin-dependent dehydrogenase
VEGGGFVSPGDQRPGNYDLIVVGGGPGGTAAAITAARTGARVLLLERGRLPRQRVCGEFVSGESLQLLGAQLGNRADTLLRTAVRISEGRLFVDGHTITAPVDPAGASISRFDLDAELWQAAEQAGVHAHLQTQVESVSGDGPFRVRTAADEFEARAVINASGRWSNLDGKRATRRGNAEPTWLGVKAHFAERESRASVDLYFFEGGYCGVQPVTARENGGPQRINACAMVRSDVAHTLPEVFARHPQLAERSRRWEPAMEAISTSPLIFQRPQPTDGRMLRVGDAAGFVDPFAGDGISLALRSGVTAVECLIPLFRQEISLGTAVERYRRVYERRLLPVFRSSSRIRRVLKLPQPVRRTILHFLEGVPAVTRYLVTATR